METIVPLLVALPLATAFIVVVAAHVPGLKRQTGALAIAVILANLVLGVSLLTLGDGSVYVGGWSPTGTDWSKF